MMDSQLFWIRSNMGILKIKRITLNFTIEVDLVCF